jgi:hypothetical protein
MPLYGAAVIDIAPLQGDSEVRQYNYVPLVVKIFNDKGHNEIQILLPQETTGEKAGRTFSPLPSLNP